MDEERFIRAWEHVCARHDTLRTVFFESIVHRGNFEQVVMGQVTPDILFTECEDEDSALQQLESQRGCSY